MRLKYFFLKLQEYTKEREEVTRWNANLVRLQTASLVNIHRGEDNQIKPENLWRYPWEEKDDDRDEILREMSPEDFAANYKRFLGLS